MAPNRLEVWLWLAYGINIVSKKRFSKISALELTTIYLKKFSPAAFSRLNVIENSENALPISRSKAYMGPRIAVTLGKLRRKQPKKTPCLCAT